MKTKFHEVAVVNECLLISSGIPLHANLFIKEFWSRDAESRYRPIHSDNEWPSSTFQTWRN